MTLPVLDTVLDINQEPVEMTASIYEHVTLNPKGFNLRAMHVKALLLSAEDLWMSTTELNETVTTTSCIHAFEELVAAGFMEHRETKDLPAEYRMTYSKYGFFRRTPLGTHFAELLVRLSPEFVEYAKTQTSVPDLQSRYRPSS